ncbi:glycoside hydrolase family 9 protein [Pedobacter rhodius]|uniref:Endoglucanase n=1 Tax=Pedobacter rhodius TaxID=3004098 RepID=A0ABT4KTZ6_9SPHI|nr:glycoside hydrolase family 9 protein [Pedobacter sp. SJ11]MCZ4222410.1 glycoside hydrolase family 9 protein [Pedobacter sp. SJ11]
MKIDFSYACIWLYLFLFSFTSNAQNKQISNIRLNQVGYYPEAPKVAVITDSSFTSFNVVRNADNKKVLEGKLKKVQGLVSSQKETFIADFSAINKPGLYKIELNNSGYSSTFEIKPAVHHSLAIAAIKAYYYQRASTALPEKYAGKWNRAAGHPDNQVLIHPSAASEQRPAGTVISAPGGWYDAGDYNKYIVNSGVTMGTMLALCEDFPDYVKMVNTNIPESGNATPDLIDELVWNLKWMLKMQDPNDGGVYNKLTNASFDGMVMPNVTRLPRYVVQKGTAATLDFAAVTAQASRLLKQYEKDLPGLADSCLAASKKAWAWALKNPDMAYDQRLVNEKFSPKITTGGYGDKNFSDEFIWAAAELYITTGDASFYKAVNMLPDERMPLPSWGNVRLLGYYSLIRNEKKLINQPANDIEIMKERVITMADRLVTGIIHTPYYTVMGQTRQDFGWGSNSQAANQGVALIQAYKISADKKYLNAALSNLDYLMGRNGTGYSFVTGIGFNTPMYPHHRPSVADKIVEPIPGLLVGGPNPGKQDGVALPSSIPDEAYVDNQASFATNEIAINWNAPLVYLANAIEALQVKAGYVKR